MKYIIVKLKHRGAEITIIHINKTGPRSLGRDYHAEVTGIRSWGKPSPPKSLRPYPRCEPSDKLNHEITVHSFTPESWSWKVYTGLQPTGIGRRYVSATHDKSPLFHPLSC